MKSSSRLVAVALIATLLLSVLPTRSAASKVLIPVLTAGFGGFLAIGFAEINRRAKDGAPTQARMSPFQLSALNVASGWRAGDVSGRCEYALARNAMDAFLYADASDTYCDADKSYIGGVLPQILNAAKAQQGSKDPTACSRATLFDQVRTNRVADCIAWDEANLEVIDRLLGALRTASVSSTTLPVFVEWNDFSICAGGLGERSNPTTASSCVAALATTTNSYYDAGHGLARACDFAWRAYLPPEGVLDAMVQQGAASRIPDAGFTSFDYAPCKMKVSPQPSPLIAGSAMRDIVSVSRARDGSLLASGVFPPNSTIVLDSNSIGYENMDFTDDVVVFAPPIHSVNITAVTLTLNGINTIDLTPQLPVPAAPAGQPTTPGQTAETKSGTGGTSGSVGIAGLAGVGLIFSAQHLSADNGALWVRIDGLAGGPGQHGGDGGKGGGPKTGGGHCYDGGNGGTGGTGGAGGAGGNTALVRFKIGPNTIVPQGAQGLAPSTRPSAANTFGTIVIEGSPGKGGVGGLGGTGGGGGEGRKCSWPASDAQAGAMGAAGSEGASGANGSFVP